MDCCLAHASFGTLHTTIQEPFSHYHSEYFHTMCSTTDGAVVLKLASNCAAATLHFDNIYNNMTNGDVL
jgi:hypothetical protein